MFGNSMPAPDGSWSTGNLHHRAPIAVLAITRPVFGYLVVYVIGKFYHVAVAVFLFLRLMK